MLDGAPGKNQGAHSTAGLAKATHSPLFPKMLSNLSFFFRHVRQWINENREQPGEVIRTAVQQQKTGLRRDRHADFIGDRKTATSLETFFRKKYLYVTKEFRAVGGRQAAAKYNMALNQRQPFLRERSGSQAPSPAVFQPGKDHSAI